MPARTPGRWRSGAKVVVNTKDGRFSCTNLGEQVGYDDIARKPEGCGPLSVFRTSSHALNWIAWITFTTTERSWVAKGDLEAILCVYKQSKNRGVWSKRDEHRNVVGAAIPSIPGIDFADTVIPLRMDEITEIKETRE